MTARYIQSEKVKKGINNSELAEFLGMSLQKFYYKQKHDSWTLEEIFCLAKYFGVSIEYLIKGEK